MENNMQDLAKSFNIPGAVEFAPGEGGMCRAVVKTDLAEAEIYLLGAMVTHFQPAGAKPVLWLSRENEFAAGNNIHGGVPICHPWFAIPDDDPQANLHGFVRDVEWKVESVSQGPDGKVTLKFVFPPQSPMAEKWRGRFNTSMEITVGSELTMKLRTENISDEPLKITEALHTYYSVSDVRKVSLLGLEDTEYLDKVQNFARFTQDAQPKTFSAHTDSVYINTDTTCAIHDPDWGRKIIIAKAGSLTTVVWNPWQGGAAGRG
ncbi:MAG TPA: D-hexose-6-phosphate mutarotase, partial [Phycisphaerae bacterium]|nr:D-hexose-6-phosphate mutarotase [Phycisphaerae bacterium]